MKPWLTSSERPWWAPDAQGFVIAAVIFLVGLSLVMRMSHPVEVNDKLLDMMLTILYGTAFVAIINYLVGSSRGSQAKDETQSKLVEKLATSVGTGNGVAVIETAKTAVVPAASDAAEPKEKQP